jgi:pimeloyl-ACP methyl ester carboxylesterase
VKPTRRPQIANAQPVSVSAGLTYRTAVCGPACTVVWEGRSREASPYPDCGPSDCHPERSEVEGPAVVILSAGGVSPPKSKDPYSGAQDHGGGAGRKPAGGRVGGDAPASLSRITASTLIVYGDRDPLYPVEMAVDMYHAIPRSALWVVPNGGHGPIFFDAAPQFVQTALSFFRTQAGMPRL